MEYKFCDGCGKHVTQAKKQQDQLRPIKIVVYFDGNPCSEKTVTIGIPTRVGFFCTRCRDKAKAAVIDAVKPALKPFENPKYEEHQALLHNMEGLDSLCLLSISSGSVQMVQGPCVVKDEDNGKGAADVIDEEPV